MEKSLWWMAGIGLQNHGDCQKNICVKLVVPLKRGPGWRNQEGGLQRASCKQFTELLFFSHLNGPLSWVKVGSDIHYLESSSLIYQFSEIIVITEIWR
jgi:hypothetical protein